MNPSKKIHLLLVALLMHFSLLSQEIDSNSYDRISSLSTPRYVDFADMNLDGIMDMIGVYGNLNANIEIHLGTSEGTFVLDTTLDGSGSPGAQYYYVELGDLNNDTYPDIVAVSNINGIIFMSDGEGKYSEYSVDSNSGDYSGLGTSITDINDDGKLDLIYDRHVHLNDGLGDLSTINRYIGGNGAIETIDFDDDLTIDLIVGDPGLGYLRFYKGNGDGTFSASADLQFEALVTDIKIHDFNGDDLDDVILKDPYNNPSRFIILYNDENHLFTQSDTLDLGHDYFSVLDIADCDLDGIDDIVGSNDDDMFYWPLSSDGTIGEKTLVEVPTGPLREFHYTDAIGESFKDLVFVNGTGTTIIFSDKLNTSISQTASSTTYTGKVYDAFETDVNVDSVAVVDQNTSAPVIIPGEYLVNLTVVDDNYEGNASFPVSITKAPLEISAPDAFRFYGENNPIFDIVYNGFVNNENAGDLTVKATATTSATVDSPVGQYPIIVSGAESENYSFEYTDGILTIEEPLSASNEASTIIYPNPVSSNAFKIESPLIIEKYTLTDLDGKSIPIKVIGNKVEVTSIDSGVYLFTIHYKNDLSKTFKVVFD